MPIMSRLTLSLLVFCQYIVSGVLAASVIVDDRDGSVTASGQWARGKGNPQEYLQTTSQGTSGATLSLAFQGTGVAVFATVGPGNATTQSFSIDGGPSTSYTSTVSATPGALPAFHTGIFSAQNLADSPHTLVITQTDNGNNILIDYFLVEPGSDGDLDGRILFCDDTDSEIQYSGAWSGSAGTVQDLQGTLHEATGQGASAEITFDGTGVIVYGSVPQGASGSVATFSMDGNSQTYTVPGSLAYDAGVAANQQIFEASGLPAGIHSLVMTAQSANVFFLDYVTISGFIDPSSLPPTQTSTPFVGASVSTGPSQSAAQSPGSQSQSPSGTGTGAGAAAAATSVSVSATTQTFLLSFGLPSSSTTGAPSSTGTTSYAEAFSSTNPAASFISSSSRPTGAASTDSTASPPSAAVIGSIAGGAVALLAASTVFLWICLRRRSHKRQRRFQQLGEDFGGYGSTNAFRDPPVHPAFASRRTSVRTLSDHALARSIRLSADSSAFPADRSYFDFSGPASAVPLVAMVGGSVRRTPSHASLLPVVDATLGRRGAGPVRPPRPAGLDISLSRTATVSRSEVPPTSEIDFSDVKQPMPEDTSTNLRALPRPPTLDSGIRIVIPPPSPTPDRDTWASDDVPPVYTPA